MENKDSCPKKAIAVFSEAPADTVCYDDYHMAIAEAYEYADQNNMEIAEEIITSGNFHSNMTAEYIKIVDFIKKQEGQVIILIASRSALSMKAAQVQEMKKFLETGKAEIHFVGTNIIFHDKMKDADNIDAFLEFLFVPVAKEILFEKFPELKGKYEQDTSEKVVK